MKHGCLGASRPEFPGERINLAEMEGLSFRVHVADVADVHDLAGVSDGALEFFGMDEPQAACRSVIPVWFGPLFSSDGFAPGAIWIA